MEDLSSATGKAWLHFHAALMMRGDRECRPGFRS
jgi:hypothetical protein